MALERNPFGGPVTVGVDNGVPFARDFAGLVEEALGWWNANCERYAGWDVAFRLHPDHGNPTVLVRFVEDLDGDAAGRAPLLRGPYRRDDPLVVRVRGTFSDASTVEVLKHELGHVLGFEHGDEPRELMAARSTMTTLPQPAATERDLPWEDATLSVDAAYGDAPGPDDTARAQVRAAFYYFESGADGTVPGEVAFVEAPSAEHADIVVRFGVPDGGVASRYRVEGRDPDGDGDLETYTKLEVTVGDVPPSHVGWHVARWLGHGFGLRGDELPPPLRDDTPRHRRGREWWE